MISFFSFLPGHGLITPSRNRFVQSHQLITLAWRPCSTLKMDSTNLPDESSSSHKRNAFSELMSPKPEQPKPTSHQPPLLTKTTNLRRHGNDRRDGLLDYIQNPTLFPPTRVIYHNVDFVVINDLYPKASVHLL